MVTAKDVCGVMAMMPSFSTENADDLNASTTVAVDNLQVGVDRMIQDGIDVITTTGSFGECYNVFWDEFKTIASATVEAAIRHFSKDLGTPGRDNDFGDGLIDARATLRGLGLLR